MAGLTVSVIGAAIGSAIKKIFSVALAAWAMFTLGRKESELERMTEQEKRIRKINEARDEAHYDKKPDPFIRDRDNDNDAA
jgi:hypothetical protein